jgi:peptidoglycan/LPS O-acetylase OafA/YrhL
MDQFAVKEMTGMNETSFSVSAPSTCPTVVIDAQARAGTAEPVWLWRGEIPSLNGLRAASILMVLVSHLAHQGTLVPNVWYLCELGHLGVDMFFVISGFLITLLLLREHRRTEAISLKQFYIRRAYRILPAYAFFLLGLAVFSWLNAVSLTGLDWFGVLTYTVSFLPKASWDVGHIWSLCVEEHFYLLWPLALFLWPRRGWVVVIVAIVLTPLLRWFIHTEVPALQVDYCSLTRLGTIAIGCGLAYMVCWPPFRRLFDVTPLSAYLLTLGLALGVAMSERTAQRVIEYQLLLHPLVVALAYALTIWLWTQHTNTLLGSLLNSKPAMVIGVLSYSIYLWQQPFLNPYSNGWFAQGPLNLLCVAVLAGLSYLLIERPFLLLKDRRRPVPAEVRVPEVAVSSVPSGG